jgi:hypothetical protein
MAEPAPSGHLDELDGLNATRALILEAYYALRRRSTPREIGTRQIAVWIERHEPEESMPSDALIQLTLKQAKVPHRRPGRPRKGSTALLLVSPSFSPGSAPAPQPAAAAGTLLWPALLAEPLAQIATQMAAVIEPLPEAPGNEETAQPALSGEAALIETHLGALVGRLMSPGGWVAGERRAGAEPMWTGRARPYEESTLRKQARQLARRGGTDVVAAAVEAQVHKGVTASGARAMAYTDMYDQVYWTKKARARRTHWQSGQPPACGHVLRPDLRATAQGSRVGISRLLAQARQPIAGCSGGVA